MSTQHSTWLARAWPWSSAKKFDVGAVVDAVKRVAFPAPVGHHDAYTNESEVDAVRKCLNEGIADYGFVRTFEKKLAARCGVARAIATTNGTASLHAALLAVGVKPGELVIVPSMSFIAPAAAVRHAGADPIFVDADQATYGIAPYKLRRFIERESTLKRDGSYLRLNGKRIAAIIAVHVFGLPCRMDEINAVAKEHNIPLIEDAAEALGSAISGRPCGSFGKIAVLSFNLNKIVTTGAGGAILTSDEGLADKLEAMVTTARIKHPWEVSHNAVAYNYRMASVNAAIGCAQMERLDAALTVKAALADRYAGSMTSVPGVVMHKVEQGTAWNHWLNLMLVNPNWHGGRTQILSALHRAGLKARAAFTPLHRLPCFAGCVTNDPVISDGIYERAVCLPSGIGLALMKNGGY